MSLEQRAPDLGSLELLAGVAELGSVGAAARRYGVSQPAASLRLRALERRLGFAVLDRSPTGSKLTPAGVAVVDWARPILDATDAFVHGVAALRRERTQRLRVAASLTVADHLIPAWLLALHTARPDMSVALEVGNSVHVADWVRAGDAEIGFIEGPRTPTGLHSRVVGGDELVVVVAPTHSWVRRRRPLTAVELADTPLVVRENGSGTREYLERALAAAGLTLRPALELGSTAAIKAAVADGEHPTVLSALSVATELAAGRLVAVPVEDLRLPRRFRAIWRGQRPGQAAATLLAFVLRKS